jgi:hypothetical protein
VVDVAASYGVDRATLYRKRHELPRRPVATIAS